MNAIDLAGCRFWGRAPRGSYAGWAALVLSLSASAVSAQNPIVVENALPGNPPSEWDVSGAGDPGIQGFATDISVDQGETITFKILTDATDYRIDIYRIGYYGGMGARLVATVNPSAALPQAQPACVEDPATGILDCGTWSASASWAVPANATSGLYMAKLVREDPEDGRASHVPFIVRDDDGASELLFQVSETTWQAYNSYGGNSLYTGSATSPPVPRAHKVSFNRPFNTRAGTPEDWPFSAEYPMIRWLEANGYDVSYFTDTDTDRRGAELLEHDVFLSVGHDEYWSGAQRANVEAARNAGVHLAFFSGNEIYWKVRWENSLDGNDTPYRTLVCYKEGTLGEIACGGKCDPLADTWTGLWRDGCAFSPPADGCNPENALSGQISWDGSTGTIQVPDTYKNLRFWRNTAVAALGSGATLSLAGSTLGYEWDFEQYAASYPPGRVKMSNTLFNGKRHHLSLYRHASGALVFGAGTVQWSWGLDGNHDRGGSVPSLDMQQATVNLLAEMGAQPATPQPGIVAVVATEDATPPLTTIGFPVDGGTVPSGVPVVISGTALDGGGAVGVVEVSVDGGATWAPASGAENWTFAWTPGSPGAVNLRARAADDWGNLEIAGPGINITVDPAPPAMCPCNIWAAGTTPGTIDPGDGNSIEVGVKFRADVDGTIEGIRFYKGAANTGTHIGNLWTPGGALLGSVTFTGETASDWQEALFASPIAVTANTTYIASVFMPAGHYSFDGGYFASQGVDNPPLHALQDGVDGPNGVFAYGAVSSFPTSTYNSSNYWIDVVFDAPSGPDVTAPTVTAIVPGNGASGIGVLTDLTVTFSEPMDPVTFNGVTFQVRDQEALLVPGTVSYEPAFRRARLDPTSALEYSTLYTVTVQGGPGGVTDVAGNPLAADFVWSFTTAAPPPPPPDEGPGGPILVISTAANPFTRYFAEILRTEGLNAFTASDITLVTPAVLANYDVVILGEMGLTAGEVTMLSDWVDAGGTLVAMRPDAQLAGLLGLTPGGGTLAEGYLLIDTASGPGSGLVAETIQFHGTADLYTLNGAIAVGTLYSDAATATANPAVTLRLVGGNGGRAIAFTYDLARSVVYTRQGNPAWAGQERDGTAPIRPNDLFYGAAAGDPQPDWVDLDKVAIPQADEQQRLLANLILTGNLHRKPLPRFWYFPKGKKAVVIMTGDNHGTGGMQPRFDTYLAQSPAGCSLPDWECVRASGYLYVGGGFSDAQALSYHNQGFEVGLHVDTGCADWTAGSLDANYTTQLGGFAGAYPSVPGPSTNRTHCVAWSEWSTQADVSVAHGIRLDTNYYFWPPGWVQNRPGMFTGSGMPMRFARPDGSMVDCYQAATQMTDESGQAYPSTIDQLLAKALGPEGYYGAFTANMHFDYVPHASSDAIVASALAHGVPVVSGRQMLEWLDGRNGSSFANLAWAGNQLSFDIAVGAGANNLQALLPTMAAVGQLSSLTRDAAPVAYSTQTIKGISYAVFPGDAGSYVATYIVDMAAPVITGPTVTFLPDDTVEISWMTDEPSDSRVDYGTDPGALASSVSSATLVTSHSIVLAGLIPNTTYYFRVTSADAASNSATEPEPPDAPLSFLTPDAPCAEDAMEADFAAGTPDANTRVAVAVDGEVILAPERSADFSVLPPTSEWDGFPWAGGGTATVTGGQLVVDGLRFNSEPLAGYGPGRSLEFVATFRGAGNQHIGFGAGGDVAPSEIFNTVPFVIFSTGATGTALMARVWSGVSTDVTLGPAYLGAPHLYRIDWSPSSVDFSIDGALVHSEPQAVPGPMRPAISDIAVGGATLDVDWIRMTPYAAAGSFTSRVHTTGASASWGAFNWLADTPAGTSLSMFFRTGDTPVPDGSWTAFSPVAASGTVLGVTSLYLQYRADLASGDPEATPVLHEVSIACSPGGPDVTPPLITNIVATPGPGGTTGTITWDTNELADSKVEYGTDPGSLPSMVSDPALVLAHSLELTGLPPGTQIFYRVTSADGSSNATTEPMSPNPPLSFFTEQAACFVDVTVSDFAAGTPDGNIYLAETADGEVILAPALGAEFPGAALPAGWGSFPWGGSGTAAVGGGQVVVDGSRINPTPGPSFGPGTSLEFVAIFAAAPYQHAGFGGGNDTAPGEIFNTFPWAMFSTGGSGTQLQARVWDGGPFVDVNLGAAYLGSPHRYRIDWGASQIDFLVDGVLVHSQAVAIAGPMRPAISDFTVGGATVSADWLRATPYAGAGSFTSRVFDAGTAVAWGEATWNATTPTGTALDLLVRQGDTPVPDGTWTAFAAIPGSGSVVGGVSRYVQYRADLSTADPSATPSLEDFTLKCGPPVGGSTVTPAPLTACLSSTSGCATVQFNIERTILTDARGFSVTFQLSSELALCTATPGTDIREGTYLGSVGATSFERIDNGGGSYTVDAAILGEPCGATAAAGTLFEVDLTNAGPDGVGTVTITALLLRDCDNLGLAVAAGDPAALTIDTTAPAALADLSPAQATTGAPPGAGPGRTAIQIGWSAGESGSTVEVYRKGFGNYPEYDDPPGSGSVPTAPGSPSLALAEGWTLVGSTGGTALDDAPATRDSWHYVAFVLDGCGNPSLPSNLSDGTLNYHLGDVSDGLTPGDGDNLVDGADVSALGAAYATTEGHPDYRNFLDVGPTVDLAPGSRPTTDNAIEFEDLILFAINFGAVAKPFLAKTEDGTGSQLALRVPTTLPAVGETFDVSLDLTADGNLQGLSVPLEWNRAAVEPVGYEPGDLTAGQEGQVWILSPWPGTVDAAVFGSGFRGRGILAVVRFRVRAAGEAGIRLGQVRARDGRNRPVVLSGEAAIERPSDPGPPSFTQLLPSAPNPFRSETLLRFSLAKEGAVSIRVYGINGRLVRTLLDEAMEAGRHDLRWDGRDAGGAQVPPGVYFVQFIAPEASAKQRIVRIR